MTEADAGLSERDFAVLNAIHLKRLVDDAQLGLLTGFDQTEIAPLLERAAATDLVLTMDSGHMLLAAGTDAVRAHYDKAYAGLRCDAELDAWYTRFETLNHRFIGLLSSWQADADDDTLFKALDTVEQLNRALDVLLRRIPRYAGYQRRFAAAVEAIEDGDTDLLCNPRRDSAHNIWFEFHEDILSVLGRPRETT